MKIIHKHALAIRWFHWINFPVLLVMIWSGFLIYWANDVYAIKVGETEILKFFPLWFYNALSIPNRLAEGMAYHFVFMWVFFLNGLLYILYTAFSGEWRLLVPARKDFRDSALLVLNSLRPAKHKVVGLTKYNPAQRVAYSSIIVMGLGSVLSGLAIYKPVQFGWLCVLMGGYEAARLFHFMLTIGYCLFFVIHIFQVIRAGWQNFQAMITGFEIMPSQDEKAQHRFNNDTGEVDEQIKQENENKF